MSGIYFSFGGAAKLRRPGGRAAPHLHVNEPKKTGARNARARTRGQNPLVAIYVLLHWEAYNKGSFVGHIGSSIRREDIQIHTDRNRGTKEQCGCSLNFDLCKFFLIVNYKQNAGGKY